MPRLLTLFAVLALGIAPAYGQSPSGTWPAEAAEAAGYPYNVPYGGHPPGGYENRIGSPYYWSVPGSTVPLAQVAGGGGGYSGGGVAGGTYGGGGGSVGVGSVGVGSVGGQAGGCPCSRGQSSTVGYQGDTAGYAPQVAYNNSQYKGSQYDGGQFGGGYANGGYADGGYASGGVGVDGPPPVGPAADPYTHHFGPGYYRSGEFGHYRFPYYSYRRPWYDVGHPVYVRDTNLPW